MAKYEEAILEIVELRECDIIATSDLGDGGDIDDGGWTNTGTTW